ncbi:hypothetical protein SAMN03159443_04275 [Pseudomonas sp. NFACC15-1]|uniref:hypothetical protein n=1 Tax=unclassified Pseudomonas TaxID=196821 RepID=UPI000885DD98|nr:MULTISPECIES: hypothetical protein [unclassified Pseudomonas]SDA89591.1 hypothetical protein SAMN03159443_04275 [Pseudomonas sp. NFACC15-1]SDW12907.1 hypothetical protein SAMN03159380_00082 [Pseudomonas sp. NFACC14]
MEFSALRKAAIRLACSHVEDREWILARLEPEERRQVEVLLEEINLLGLSSDPSVVAALMSELAVAPSAARPTPDNAPLKARLSKATHPFWGALVLQLETATARREVLGGLANSAEIRRWDSKFAKQVLPPALMNSLKARMDVQEAGDEPA